MTKDYHRLPRLHSPERLNISDQIPLTKDQDHYLRHVLRLTAHDHLRIFNEQDGEFLSELMITKKEARILVREQLRPAMTFSAKTRYGLAFSLIKKEALAWMIEKAVELGVKDFYPLTSDHSSQRDIRPDKINSYIIEASEQCERMDIPKCHALQSLKEFVAHHPNCVVAVERDAGSTPLDALKSPAILVVGPEGGWSDAEKESFKMQNLKTVHFGESILRAETAALFGLSLLKARSEDG
jgi:16S rRNA (uracil1498-N3)-methyltransferase